LDGFVPGASLRRCRAFCILNADFEYLVKPETILAVGLFDIVPLLAINSKPMILIFLLALIAVPASHGQDVSVQSELVKWHKINRGATETGDIRVRNQSSEEVRVEAEVKNYFFGVGKNGYENDHSRSLNEHIKLSANEIRIPPNSRRAVEYEAKMPEGGQDGSYWSMILISTTSPGATEGDISIQHQYEWGINVVASNGGGEPKLEAKNIAASDSSLSVTIENTGEVSLRPDLILEGYSGSTEERVKGQQHLLHPGTSRRTKFDVSEFKPGNYTGAIIFEGREKTYGLRIKFSIP
jgi:hypothetical protein